MGNRLKKSLKNTGGGGGSLIGKEEREGEKS